MPSLNVNTRTFSPLTADDLGSIETIATSIDAEATVVPGDRTAEISAPTRDALGKIDTALRNAGYHFSISATGH